MQCPTNASAKPNTVITNLQVTFSATPNDDPYKSSYAYRASVTHSDITEDMSATIVFNDAQASSGNYAPFCVTYDGGIYIYAKVNTTITIPTIKVNGVISYFNLNGTVGDDTHPIKIVNGQAVAVTNSLLSSEGNVTIHGDALTLGLNQEIYLVKQSDSTNAHAILSIRHPTTNYYARLVLAVNSSNVVGLALQKLNAQGGWVSEQQIISF